MDWFHCNKCFRQEGSRFAVTSCGHVLCAPCGAAGPCPVCGASGRFLPICPQLRPQEKLFFQSPAAIALQHLARIAQVGRFQRAQAELLLASQRRHSAAMERAERALGTRERELESLRRENTELRRAQLSPSWRGCSRSSTPRPVGVTSPAQPVTPQPRRQLSGQVVSRSAPLEPPLSRSAFGGGGTPSASSTGRRTPQRAGVPPTLRCALPLAPPLASIYGAHAP